MKTATVLIAIVLFLPACDLLSGHGSDEHDPGADADGGGDTGSGGGNGSESGNMAGMTEAHNEYRQEEHDVTLVWNDEIAAYAQEWAEYLRDNHDCNLQHRAWLGMAEKGYGENLYGASAWGMRLNTTPQEVVAAWWSEVSDYDYASNSCTGVCGHYTQLMWKGSTHLGCGVAFCDGGDGTQSDVWVCNYNPPGNYIGQKPW
ncbi:MAG: CAP domain-containing protein [Pseudomonadota bacterium]